MNVVRIRLLDNGRLNVTPYYAEHFNYYDEILRNVVIESCNFQKNKDLKIANLTNYMSKKCSENLYKIYIVGDIELEEFGQKIERNLRNVDTVEFRNRKGAVDEDRFLQRCQNLKKLILGEALNGANVAAILQQRYEHLTHFAYLYGNTLDLTSATLTAFSQNNQIKSIVWKFRMYGTVGRIHSVECIRTLQHFQHLTHFFLSFSSQLPRYTRREFLNIRDQLHELCARDAFKSLQIEVIRPRQSRETEIIISRMTEFARWHKLTKIHLRRFPIAVLLPILRPLANLRAMCLDDCLMDEPEYDSTDGESDTSSNTDDNVTFALPQVRELYFINRSFNSLTRLCMLPIKYWINLERIYAPVSNYGISLDIAELSEARANLDHAREVTIFTNHRSLPTNMTYDLVKLKCVNSIKVAQNQRSRR